VNASSATQSSGRGDWRKLIKPKSRPEATPLPQDQEPAATLKKVNGHSHVPAITQSEYQSGRGAAASSSSVPTDSLPQPAAEKTTATPEAYRRALAKLVLQGIHFDHDNTGGMRLDFGHCSIRVFADEPTGRTGHQQSSSQPGAEDTPDTADASGAIRAGRGNHTTGDSFCSGSASPAAIASRMRLFLAYGPEREVWRFYSLAREMTRPAVWQQFRSIMMERYIEDTERVANSYYYNKIPEYTLVDKQDVRQAAILGMMDAFDEYDYRAGTTFMQWANAKRHSRIRGSIIDMLRKLMEFPRIIADYRRQLHPKIASLTQKIGKKPSVEDFVAEYGEEYREILEDELFASGVFNQHQVAEEDKDRSRSGLDALSALEDYRKSHVDEDAWTTEDRASFHEVVLGVIDDERERFAVYAYYYMKWNNETIAKSPSMNCCTSTALVLRTNGERKIRAAFTYTEAMELLHQYRH
jgi:RNA polymerase sigma factor FliA